jgi:MinD-like ATPase involved in chromosome partitioning or flagellar assembly
MSVEERIWRAARDSVQTQFDGPRTVVFANPKGGTATTTSTLLAAGTFGTHRGGGVVAMDAHETRGTLGERARPAPHAATVRDLLENVGLFQRSEARIGDLGRFMRGQGAAHFDVLASDERPGATGQIDATAYRQVHELLRRYYHLVLVDTGGNMRAESWQAAVTSADLVVVTVTVRQDAASAALWMADALEQSVLKAADLRRRCVTLVCDPSPGTDPRLRAHLAEIFRSRCRTVIPIPYDASLADGGAIVHDRLSSATRTAWLYACAAMTTALSDAAADREH